MKVQGSIDQRVIDAQQKRIEDEQTWAVLKKLEPELARLEALMRFQRHTVVVTADPKGGPNPAYRQQEIVWREVNRRLATLIGRGRGRPNERALVDNPDWDEIMAAAIAEEQDLAAVRAKEMSEGKSVLYSSESHGVANHMLHETMTGQRL